MGDPEVTAAHADPLGFTSPDGPDRQQLDTFRERSRQRDEAAEALAACRAALHGWAGPDVAFAGLSLLASAELPGEVAAAVRSRQDTERRVAALQRELEERQVERAQWTSGDAALQAQLAAHAREEAVVQALAALCPTAERLNTVRARLAQALTRQAAQQGRGLATLWSAVSGQAGALQREVDQARADEGVALLAYESCARQRGVLPVPDPAGVPGRVAREQARLNARRQDLARQRQAAQTALRALDDQDEGTRAALRALRQQAASVWTAAQQGYALPIWDRWADLWRRRGDARLLWERHADAECHLQEATRALEVHLETFPAHLHDPAEVTRQFEALHEAAAARLQAARERAEALELARIREEQAQREETQRRQAELAVRRRETRLAVLDVLLGRLAHLTRASQRAEDAVRAQPPSQDALPDLPGAVPDFPAGARERLVALVAGPQSTAPQLQSVEPSTPPAVPGAHLPLESPVDRAAVQSPAPDGQAGVPALGEDERAAARALLVRHAALAAQIAMCLEALEDWAGPGVTGGDALRLAEQVSQLSPADAQDPVAVHRSADAPVTPERWHHLWTQRYRGSTLRRTWLDARAAITALEDQMAPLWAAWPAGARHVAALRQATGTATPAAPATTAPILLRPPAPPAPGAAATPHSPGSPRPVQLEVATPSCPPVGLPAPAASGATDGPWTPPRLTPEQVPAARALLARFDSLGEQEHRTLDALADWAGPGLNGPRLAELVSGPLPGEITQALEAWTRTREAPASHVPPERARIGAAVQAEKDRSAAVLGPLRQLQVPAEAVIQAEHALAGARGPALPRIERRLHDARATYAAQAAKLGFVTVPPPRRIAILIQDELTTFNRRLQPLDAQWKALLDRPEPAPPALPGRWKRAWAAVSGRYGLPLHPDTWERSIWPRRAEGERLWTELQNVRRQRQAAQEDLTALCATWPAGARTVDSLRQAAGGASAPSPAPLPTPPPTPAPRTPPGPTASARPVPAPVPTARRAAPSAGSSRPAPTLPPVAPPPPVQLAPVQPASAARPSVPGVAAPGPVPRPAPPPPVAPDLQPGPAAIPQAARAGTPPVIPAPLAPAPLPSAPLPSAAVAPVPGRPSSVTPPMTPPAPLPPAPRPPAGPSSSRPVPLPLLPPAHGVPRPVTRPPAPETGGEPSTGRLTRRQRAEREAVRISDQYDWEKGFHLIADALDRDRWGQLRESIEREIALGMTPDEFELLLQLRAYWHDQTHYQSPYTAQYDSLPWGLGIALIRRCAGVPCLDDMILLLERLYEYAQVACSPRSLPAFSQRLGAILDRADPDVDLDYWLSTREDR